MFQRKRIEVEEKKSEIGRIQVCFKIDIFMWLTLIRRDLKCTKDEDEKMDDNPIKFKQKGLNNLQIKWRWRDCARVIIQTQKFIYSNYCIKLLWYHALKCQVQYIQLPRILF